MNSDHKCNLNPLCAKPMLHFGECSTISGRWLTDAACAACDHDRDAHAENGMSDNAGRFGGPCDMPDCPCKVFE